MPGSLASRAVLAAPVFGNGTVVPAPGIALVVPCPAIAPGSGAEIFAASGPVERIDLGAARAAADGSRIAVSLAVPDVAGPALEARASAAYRRLLSDLERAGYPHLVRMWNFVPAINGHAAGLERYKLFSKARAEAFEAAYGPEFAARLPASSAVGSEGNALVVHAIAARLPGRHVENPRQVAAYRYPVRYGPRSPSFARATVARGPRGEEILVSGTASVVGHESAFPDDAARQAEETMTNIEAVVAAASGGRRFVAEAMRAYLRRPGDLDAVRAVVSRRAPGVPTAWLRADICREELVVEIEAVFRATLGA